MIEEKMMNMFYKFDGDFNRGRVDNFIKRIVKKRNVKMAEDS